MRKIHVPGPMQVGLRKMCRKEIIVSVNIEHGGRTRRQGRGAGGHLNGSFWIMTLLGEPRHQPPGPMSSRPDPT